MYRFLPILFCCPSATAADEDDSFLQAQNAAVLREEQFMRLSITWKVTNFIPKGGRMDADAAGLPVPRSDVTVDSTHRLVLDCDRFRSEHEDAGFGKQAAVAEDGVETFDGERSYKRIYFNGRDKPASLILERSNARPVPVGPSGRPIGLWCRGTLYEPFAHENSPVLAVVPTKINGEFCLEVRLRRSNDISTAYLLDPRRNYLVRRIRDDAPGTAEVTDIEYREYPKVGWAPRAWTTVKTRAGDQLVSRVRAEVTDVRLIGAVPGETFRLEPLPGETVADNDTHKEYRVRDDGELEAWDPAAGQLRPPVSPERRPFVWPGRDLVRYGIVPALFLFLIGILVLRRRRRLPNTPSS